MRGLTRRIAGLAATLMPMVPAEAEAQALPPETVNTRYVSDTLPGYGAVGVAMDSSTAIARITLEPDPENPRARVRLAPVGGGS